MTNIITKRLIGKQDSKPWDGVNTTFTAITDEGVTLTLNRVGNTVDVLSSYGYFNTKTSTVINSAISAVSTTACGLELTPGNWVISTDVTFAATSTPIIQPGAILQVANGITVTINSPPIVGKYKWIELTGTGKVVFANIEEVFPEWWGWATTNTAAQNTTILQAVITSLATGTGKIKLSPGEYPLNPITISAQGLIIEGPASGQHSTSYSYYGTKLTYSGTDSLFTFTLGSGQILRNLMINMTGTDGIAVEIGAGSGRGLIDNIRFEYPDSCTSGAIAIRFNTDTGRSNCWKIQDCYIYKPYYGIKVESCTGGGNKVTVFNTEIGYCVYGIYVTGDGTYPTSFNVIDCSIEQCTKTHIFHDGIGGLIFGTHFESGSAWDAWAVPADTTTKSPILLGANSQNITVLGNTFYPFNAANVFTSLGIRYYYNHPQGGVKRTSYDVVSNITQTATAIGSIPYIIQALSGQTADLFESQLSDTTKIWALSPNGVPYDRYYAISSAAGVLTCNCATGRKFSVTLSENVTSVIFSNGIDGMEITLSILGAASWTIPADTAWTDGADQTYFAGGAAPAAPAAGKTLILKFIFNGTRWKEVSRAVDIES